MKTYFTLLCLVAVASVRAQDPADMLRYSFYPTSGSARNVAIGGAMGSLGGDISSLFINPAGLGMYKTGEFVLTPGWGLNHNHNDYRGTAAASQLNKFQLGTCGFVFGQSAWDASSHWKGHAWSIALTKLADYNNHNVYQGLNTYSSYSEQYAEDAAQDGRTIDQILNDPGKAFGTSLALDTYLVDTFSTPSGLQYRGLPQFLLAKNIPLLQQKTVDAAGGLSEVAIGYGTSYKEKLYIGINAGIPILYYNETTTFTESASKPDPAGQFVSSTLTETRIVKGDGVYARVGVIYKPVSAVRLGFAFTTPSLVGVTETRSDTMVTNTGSYAGIRTAGSTTFLAGADPSFNYNLHTPWRALVSGAYVFHAVQDVRQQRGFLTADLEYVRYTSGSYHVPPNTGQNVPSGFYDGLNGVLKGLYRGTLNLKAGGELKLTTYLFRLGFAHYGNPYRDVSDLKAGKNVFSGGVGYRNFGIFADLTYAYSIQKEVDFPYLLADKANTFADLTDRRGEILLTLGVKL
ncbi:hypothetical protein [Dinghuibacter silviterrae]|uniref:Outer membrane protein transport protein (OMPP1/FadL/TodX) n=1 Tax=Dinghuibacter silviterrae TaxID=1539049 RepID=A0A4R8DSA9_9BACT|nr:hypothetical protein [Dinghuibacter silviterrae]TDX00919.1 hypothetical protein EDB95_1949 [Dinghuibacter silviterrae]